MKILTQSLKGILLLWAFAFVAKQSFASHLINTSTPSQKGIMFQLVFPQDALVGSDDEEEDYADYTWNERYLQEPVMSEDIFSSEIIGATKIGSCKVQNKEEALLSCKRDLYGYGKNVTERTEGVFTYFTFDTIFNNGTTAKWRAKMEAKANGFDVVTETIEFKGKGHMEMIKYLALDTNLQFQGAVVLGKAVLKTQIKKPWGIPSGFFYRKAKEENIKQFKPRFNKALTSIGQPLCWDRVSLPTEQGPKRIALNY